MKTRIVKELPDIILLLALFTAAWFVYPHLPDRIPSHWNINGQVDGWSGRFSGAFLMPFMALGIYVLFLVLPYIDPRRENYQKFATVYHKFITMMIAFFAIIYAANMLYVFKYLTSMTKVINFIVAVLFIFIGNYLGKIRQNYFIGLKFPWTLADEEVWNRTHRLGGKLWVLTGIVGLLSITLPVPYNMWALFGTLAVTTIITVIYSYIIFKNKKNIVV